MELGSRNVFLGASFHFILQQTWEFVKKQCYALQNEIRMQSSLRNENRRSSKPVG